MTEEQLTPTVAAELRDEAQGQLDATVALRRTLHRVAGGRQRPAASPATEVLDALEGLPLDITAARVDERHRRPAHRRPSRARRSCSAATWTPCRCTRTPGSTSRPRVDDRCTPAGTTPTRRCSSARPGCSAPRRPTSPAACCSCSSPARRATTAPATCSTRACSTCPPLADGTTSPVTGGVRHAHHLVAADRVGSAPRQGPIMASADTLRSRSPARAATPASRIGRSTRSRSPARSSRRCRRWSPARIDVFDPSRRHRRPHHRRHDEQRHPRDGRDRGHDPRRQRAHPGQRARRHPPRRRRHRRRPRRRGRGRHRATATRSRSTTATSPTFAARRGRRRRRRRPRRPPAQPDHGRRGLQLRAPAGARAR